MFLSTCLFHCKYLRTQKYEKGVWKIAPKENCPQLGLGLGLGLGLQLGLEAVFLRGNCSRTYENVVL